MAAHALGRTTLACKKHEAPQSTEVMTAAEHTTMKKVVAHSPALMHQQHAGDERTFVNMRLRRQGSLPGRYDMLTRQRTILSLLLHATRPLSPTVFVKLFFLLRHETGLAKVRSFYDFVPYDYGPFSFTLYWDLGGLEKNGYVTRDEGRIALRGRTVELAEQEARRLPMAIHGAVADVLRHYGRMSQQDLIRAVYSRYPWFALNSKLRERESVPIPRPKPACPAVYTAGYEGRSVDAFFNDLLRQGISVVVDVRANAVSRKYGFSGVRLGELCQKLGLEYRHMARLGIPSKDRAGLTTFASYQHLLLRYQRALLPHLSVEVKEVGRLMMRQPCVLVCVEKDVRCCHRSRLADAVARATGLEVVHL